eukprot:g714.t1
MSLCGTAWPVTDSCFGRGTCDEGIARCVCDAGWTATRDFSSADNCLLNEALETALYAALLLCCCLSLYVNRRSVLHLGVMWRALTNRERVAAVCCAAAPPRQWRVVLLLWSCAVAPLSAIALSVCRLLGGGAATDFVGTAIGSAWLATLFAALFLASAFMHSGLVVRQLCAAATLPSLLHGTRDGSGGSGVQPAVRMPCVWDGKLCGALSSLAAVAVLLAMLLGGGRIAAVRVFCAVRLCCQCVLWCSCHRHLTRQLRELDKLVRSGDALALSARDCIAVTFRSTIALARLEVPAHALLLSVPLTHELLAYAFPLFVIANLLYMRRIESSIAWSSAPSLAQADRLALRDVGSSALFSGARADDAFGLVVGAAGQLGRDLANVREPLLTLQHQHAMGELWVIPAADLELKRELGFGRMGKVFEGLYCSGAQVAVKQIVAPSDAIRLVPSEVERMVKLSHPNVVKFFGVSWPKADAGRAHGAMHIVAERCQRTLGQRLFEVSTEINTATLLSMVQQLCRGMAHLHKSGFVHRNLKPSNVFIDEIAQGGDRGIEIKVGDWSIVRYDVPRAAPKPAVGGARVRIGGGAKVMPLRSSPQDDPPLANQADGSSAGLIGHRSGTRSR